MLPAVSAAASAVVLAALLLPLVLTRQYRLRGSPDAGRLAHRFLALLYACALANYAFGPLPEHDEGSWRPWLDLLRESSTLPLSDEEALVRADLLQGTWFCSLSLSLVALSADRVAHEHLRLDTGSGVDLPGALAGR